MEKFDLENASAVEIVEMLESFSKKKEFNAFFEEIIKGGFFIKCLKTILESDNIKYRKLSYNVVLAFLEIIFSEEQKEFCKEEVYVFLSTGSFKKLSLVLADFEDFKKIGKQMDLYKKDAHAFKLFKALKGSEPQ